jgi:lipoprotein-anchoring transpeptidase ErfK/SrfK
VTAFQKVQGLPRAGTVGAATWKALADPHRYHLRFPTSGAAVEVNLTKQVVIYAVDGHVRRILDASTGGGYYYTDSSGNSVQALTPKGHFSIRYKINDWHRSKLGYMYRPAYFTTTGFAIHGDSYVPNYPASHGCVRITVAAMDRMYDKLTIGMPVSIYGHQVGT